MTRRLLGIGLGATALALTLTAGVAAQRAGAQPGPPESSQPMMQGPRGRGAGPMGGPRAGARPGGPGDMGPGEAQRQGRGPAMRAGRGGGPAGLLDLTADQRTAIQAIERSARDQSAALADELEFTRRTLRREVFADARNAATVQTLASKIATLEKQLFDLRVKSDVAVADVLTATQRERMRIQGGRTGQPGFGGRGRGPGRSGAGPA